MNPMLKPVLIFIAALIGLPAAQATAVLPDTYADSTLTETRTHSIDLAAPFGQADVTLSGLLALVLTANTFTLAGAIPFATTTAVPLTADGSLITMAPPDPAYPAGIWLLSLSVDFLLDTATGLWSLGSGNNPLTIADQHDPTSQPMATSAMPAAFAITPATVPEPAALLLLAPDLIALDNARNKRSLR